MRLGIIRPGPIPITGENPSAVGNAVGAVPGSSSDSSEQASVEDSSATSDQENASAPEDTE